MKSRLQGSSTHSNSSTSLKSQPPSKPKKATNPPPKSSSQSFYQQIYRLPSSMKRTEEMISKSILKQHISSRILDLVGNTFRVKNAIQSQVTFPTRNLIVNRPRPSYTKEHTSSRILETCYEEEGEDEDEDEISSNAAIHSTDRNNLSVRRNENNDSTEKSMIMNKSVGSIKVNAGNNSRNLQRMMTAGGNFSNKNSQNSSCTNMRYWDYERNSVSPGRINVKDLVKSDIRTTKPPSRKSVEKPTTGTRQKSEEKKSIPVNNNNEKNLSKKSLMMKELKKTVKMEKEKATMMTPWEGRLPRSKENETSKGATNNNLAEKSEKKILSIRTQSQEKKVQVVIKKEEADKEEAINMPRAVVQRDYYSCSSHVEINYEESSSQEIIRQTREALEKVLAPRQSKEENMKFSIYKSINDFEKKLSGHAMTRYNNLRKCLDSSEKWEDDEEIDEKEEYRIKKVVGNY